MTFVRSILPQSVCILILFPIGIVGQSIAQPKISYLIPDIGSPLMNTYTEIVGPVGVQGNFGGDGFGLNNIGDKIRVECSRPGDSSKLKFGPTVVSSEGRMIAVQIFVLPTQSPNSDFWEDLDPAFRIPIHVVFNGQVSNVDTFYIVKPQSLPHLTSKGLLGSGGNYGLRSRRGAMIVSNLIADNVFDSLGISTLDCDPTTSGNQGFLPLCLLSKGLIDLQKVKYFDNGGHFRDGGAGGGGGGGCYNDGITEGEVLPGGRGFTGGQGGTIVGGDGSGRVGTDDTHGGSSLNGVAGGRDKLGAELHNTTHSEGGQGTGGGTGFAFGTSGEGSFTEKCVIDNTVGGFGGGSGADECCCYEYQTKTSFGGGGAGFATPGTSTTSGGGFAYGNAELVPLTGGSGGAGGNPWYGQAGTGGGGGGAIALYARDGISMSQINQNGSPGVDQIVQDYAIFSGAGGGGSGGGVALATKAKISITAISEVGGRGGVARIHNTAVTAKVQDGGNGGAGRVRTDGESSNLTSVNSDATTYSGPTTDTSLYVQRTFTITGTGNGAPIHLYVASEHQPWASVGVVSQFTGSGWSASITLNDLDTLFFLVAAQEVLNQSHVAFESEPNLIFSQAAANFLITHGACSATVFMKPQRLHHAELTHSISYPLLIQIGGQVNADSLLAITKIVNFSLTFDPTALQVASVLPPAGWLVLAQSVGTGLLDVGLVRANNKTKTLDSLGVVVFNVIDVSKKHTTLELQALEVIDSSSTIGFCPYESEGSSWVILLDSLTAGVAANQLGFAVSQIYPNPTSGDLKFEVTTSKMARASVILYDVLGREATLSAPSINLHAGKNAVSLSANEIPDGVYLLRFDCAGSVTTREVRIAR